MYKQSITVVPGNQDELNCGINCCHPGTTGVGMSARIIPDLTFKTTHIDHNAKTI